MPATCEDCGLVYSAFDGHMVMLHDPLWNKVSKGRPKICLLRYLHREKAGKKANHTGLKYQESQ